MFGERRKIPPYYNPEFEDSNEVADIVPQHPKSRNLDEYLIEDLKPQNPRPELRIPQKTAEEIFDDSEFEGATKRITTKSGWVWIRQDNDGPSAMNKQENGRYYPGRKLSNHQNTHILESQKGFNKPQSNSASIAKSLFLAFLSTFYLIFLFN